MTRKSINELIAAVRGVLPQYKVHEIEAAAEKSEPDMVNGWREDQNELIRTLRQGFTTLAEAAVAMSKSV